MIIARSPRVALVTGGARGIGRAIAERLAAREFRVIIGQLDASHFTAPHGCEMWELDVTNEILIQQTVDRLVSEFGQVDVLVNNAAITGPGAGAPFLEHSTVMFEQVVRTNLIGPFIVTRTVAKAMIAGGVQGAIVNIASVDAMVAEASAVAYVASKTGLVGLTRAAAVDLGPYGIRVNAVAPGQIFTEAGLAAAAERHQGRQPHYRAGPLGDGGRPEDIAGITEFLVSPDARWLTGVVVPVDGGYLAC